MTTYLPVSINAKLFKNYNNISFQSIYSSTQTYKHSSAYLLSRVESIKLLQKDDDKWNFNSTQATFSHIHCSIGTSSKIIPTPEHPPIHFLLLNCSWALDSFRWSTWQCLLSMVILWSKRQISLSKLICRAWGIYIYR